MTGRADSLYTLMRGLGLYRLDGTTLVDQELRAYRLVFAQMEEALTGLLQDAFVQTAGARRLAQWERLMGIAPRPAASLEARRALILARLAVKPNGTTLADVTGALRGGGLIGSITERPADQALDIACLGFLGDFGDIHEVIDYAEGMLPAHLIWNFDHGSLTWDIFEGMFDTFADFDEADHDWITLDTM